MQKIYTDSGTARPVRVDLETEHVIVRGQAHAQLLDSCYIIAAHLLSCCGSWVSLEMYVEIVYTLTSDCCHPITPHTLTQMPGILTTQRSAADVESPPSSRPLPPRSPPPDTRERVEGCPLHHTCESPENGEGVRV